MISIINYNNSKEKFIEKLDEDFIQTKLIERDFIKDVAPYIQDMRTLINIINEFKIYYHIKCKINRNASEETNEKVKDEGKGDVGNNVHLFNAEKLLALIIYKNIYPLDFQALQYRTGYVFSVLKKENKTQLYESLARENEVGRIDTQIKLAKEEKIRDLDELRKIYLFELLRKCHYQPDKIIQPNINLNTILKEDNFNDILVDYDGTIEIRNLYGYNFSRITFKELEAIVNPNKTYRERERAILDFNDDKLSGLEQKKRKIKEKLLKWKNTSLEKLLENQDRATIEKYFKKYESELLQDKDSKEKNEENLEQSRKSANYQLLKLLIQRGHINEHYMEIHIIFP